MAEAVVGPLLGKLQQLAVSEAQILVSVSDDIERLRDKLVLIQAFLRDADVSRQARFDEFTRAWVKQIREAVLDAQDAVEYYFRKIDLSWHPSWIHRISARLVASFPTQLSVRHGLSRKVAAINLRLEDIIKNRDVYKPCSGPERFIPPWCTSSLTDVFAAGSRLVKLPEPYPMHIEEGEALFLSLIPTERELQYEDPRPVVISVCGKNGVGKTTLVRSVYNEMAIKNHFDVQAMVSFGPNLNATNILHKMVQKLTEDNLNCPRSKVLSMLAEKLRNKRYLLVIDGEVSSTEWKNILSILTSLKVHPNGNRIVRITQNMPEKLSNYRSVNILLNYLEEEHTIELFRSRLLYDGQDHDIEEYQQDIYEITEGLPLSVVLLSGLVQRKKFPQEWAQVFHYLKSMRLGRLDNILSLCFDDLPHELRGCFLYFTSFPTNITVKAQDLVCMWMAEGFLRAMFGNTMENVGYIYLKELIARNLVDPVHIDDASSAWSMSVTVQNNVHDFLLSEAREENFLEVLSDDDSPTLTSARRLSLQNYTDKYTALASPLPKLRSIFSQFEQESKEEQESITNVEKKAISKKKKDFRSHIQGLLHGSEFLRVINLEGIEIGEKLPLEIGSVVQLQYLAITSCSLKKIPSSIATLTSLQTLDVRKTDVRELPQAFWMITTLRHVFGFSLKLPKKIGSLKHLQTLDSIELGASEPSLPKTLGQMIHLENLYVWNITTGNMDSFSAALSYLEYLRTLALHGNNIPPSVFTTNSLRSVKFMVLQGHLELLPDLDGVDSCLPNLIELSLKETKVSQWFITKLAELPSLVTLALYAGSYKDIHLSISSGGFRCLKSIKLDVETLRTLRIENGALPELKKLDILSEQIKPDIFAEERVKETIV